MTQTQTQTPPSSSILIELLCEFTFWNILGSDTLSLSLESFLRADNNDVNQLTEKLIFGVGCILAGQFLGKCLLSSLCSKHTERIIIENIHIQREVTSARFQVQYKWLWKSYYWNNVDILLSMLWEWKESLVFSWWYLSYYLWFISFQVKYSFLISFVHFTRNPSLSFKICFHFQGWWTFFEKSKNSLFFFHSFLFLVFFRERYHFIKTIQFCLKWNETSEEKTQLFFQFILSDCFIERVFFSGSDAGGRYENALDALIQIQNNWLLLIFVISYCLSIAFYNFFGLSVAKQLTTVHRTLIDACRTILVWTAQIVIYYLITSQYGENWHSFRWYSYYRIEMKIYTNCCVWSSCVEFEFNVLTSLIFQLVTIDWVCVVGNGYSFLQQCNSTTMFNVLCNSQTNKTTLLFWRWQRWKTASRQWQKR